MVLIGKKAQKMLHSNEKFNWNDFIHLNMYGHTIAGKAANRIQESLSNDRDDICRFNALRGINKLIERKKIEHSDVSQRESRTLNIKNHYDDGQQWNGRIECYPGG